MKKQSLGAVFFGETAVAGEVAISRIPHDGQMPFGTLHAQLMASSGDGFELEERVGTALPKHFHSALGGNIASSGSANPPTLLLHRETIVPDLGWRVHATKNERVVNLAHFFLTKMKSHHFRELGINTDENHPGSRRIEAIQKPGFVRFSVRIAPGKALIMHRVSAFK